MSDRRTVSELTVEELERILIIKRREARAERVRRLREIGRLPADASLPHEDLVSVGAVAPSARTATVPKRRSGRLGAIVEPLRNKTKPTKSGGGRWQTIRDRLLLFLEAGALVGLVVVIGVSLLNIKSLNAEYANAGEVLPTATATPLAGGILPSGHTPPDDDKEVPVHLRGLVEGKEPLVVEVPTPGPEAPTRVVIPSIDVDALVVEGDSWEQLKLGVGHHLNSANPGERGNLVLSAHNDIYGEIFRHLDDLELGDEVTVYSGEQPYRYIVTAKQIVEPTDVSVLSATTKPSAWSCVT